MKIIINDLPKSSHDVERQQEERQVPKEYRMDGRIRRRPGHTLFSYNVKTGEWKVADTEKKAVVKTDGSVMYRTQVKREDGCVYIQALNLKNAMKKMDQSIRNLESSENRL
jgi:hypothetical protein